MNRDITDLNDITILVDTFYESAAEDDLLGPIFSQIENSHLHKDALYKYWETVLLTHTSTSEPFPKHIELMFSTQHFFRWLTLFLRTIDDLYSGPTSQKAKIMVMKKAEEFQSDLGFSIF
ncbi:MAG: group III truncated hemoglobin [Cyclobacteriaceae bacterium]|jgi:hemoglobin|nr:group III truncated hemoglobin [Cyclobacteriaceae bacterium]